MRKKSIAAVLLVTVLAWAEMAMVPMFAMHIWHHEASPEPVQHLVMHHEAGHAGHPCCPAFQKSPLALEFVADIVPCSDEHRCCFQRAPVSAPAPGGEDRKISQDLVQVEAAEADCGEQDLSISATPEPGLRPPPLVSGMVLRV